VKVYLVEGFDVGGNTGNTVEAVFLSREKAEAYANDPEKFKWNSCNWTDDGEGRPFEVNEYEVEDAAGAVI